MLTVDYERLGLTPGDRLLDVGCGAGRHAFAAARSGARVVALDLDDTALKDVAVTLRDVDGGPGGAVRGDTLRLPFPDATFDRIVASEILEHIPSDVAGMREIARVLRPGGTAAVTVPRFGPEIVCWALSREYHATEGGHVRIYRAQQLADRLRGAGLQPLGRDYAHALHTPYWWLRCALGVDRDTFPVHLYRRFLEWDILTGPRVVRTAERILDPLCGKSLVLYLVRGEHTGAS